MDKISLKQIKKSLPQKKNLADSIWTRYVLRPVSVPVAWLFLRVGLRANTVSYLSAAVCVVAGILFVSSSILWAVVGTLLFNIFSILDCADGNIARVTGTTGPYGGWADALGGYVAYITVLLSLGYAAALHNSVVFGWSPPSELLVLFGGIAASSNMLMRLAFQSYRNIAPEGSSGAQKSISFEKMLSENLGITGLLMPGVLISLIFNLLGYLLIFYTLFYILGCLFSLIKLIRKVEYASRKK